MMQKFLCFASILCLFTVVLGSLNEVVLYKSPTEKEFNSLDRPPARRSLLSIPDNEQHTALAAAVDGTISLVDRKSLKILWSFSSGSPIYSSYQAPVNHRNEKENTTEPGGGYFIDCNDDWKLYAHSEAGDVILDFTIEEFVGGMPQITEDGGLIVGSKATTVFLVDAKTGRLIHTYSSSLLNKSLKGSNTINSVKLKTDELPLYIIRTDYLLASYLQNSEVLWNMTVSDIGAALLCQEAHLNSGHELPSESVVQSNMPLPCQTKAVVYRSRSRNVLELLSRTNRLSPGHHEDKMLPTPSSVHVSPSQHKVDETLNIRFKNDDEPMLYLPALTKDSEPSGVQDVIKSRFSGLSILSKGSSVNTLLLFLLMVVAFLIYQCALFYGNLIKKPSNLNAKVVSPKRKKNRKSEKNSSSLVKKDKQTSSDLENGYSSIKTDETLLLNFNQLSNGCADGRKIGKLFVSNKEIAKGSNGTVVFEGIYEGRPVAVKRLVKAHHDVAFKEIQNLIASDRHSNIVRWYGAEHDQDFIYLSLERCTCSLNDLIQMHSDHSEKSGIIMAQASKAMTEYKVRLDSMKGVMQHIELWKANGYPSPILLKLMRDVVSGLAHLHELGIVHRDLKPQNVLIIKEKSLCAKLSDMGISKRLVGDMSSLGHHATGYGSSGWQAPEQLLHGRQTRAIDLFSLGCILFFCITGGRHPFGDHLERDINITKNLVDLFFVEYIPEAVDLFSRLLSPRAELRPKALDVLHHPLFWNSEMRLSFLHDTSDRVELEDRETDSNILQALERVAPVALGGKWDEKMEPNFITNIGHYRRYKFNSVRDLLRVMRNKLNHYRELPEEIQELLGPVPEGFDDYFGSRFPKLLIEVYKVMCRYCHDDKWFHKYSNSDIP